MSYLDRPRLHFFGQFTANPSTINNAPTNYSMPVPYTDPAWNPYGAHNFSLDNCAVTNIVIDGPIASDPVTGSVATSVPGVLVDLDTEQQGVSQIIGMQLTVTVGGGSVSGTFVPVNFFDMFFRANGVGADAVFGAAYQSVLTDLQWSGSSPFLDLLQAFSPTMLSIRFNVDGFQDDSTNPDFTRGRVAGTIGPQFAGDPTSFTNARFLRPLGPQFLNPTGFGNYNYAQMKFDATRNKVVVDLGNALPTNWSGNNPVAVDFPSPGIQLATVTFDGQAWSAGTIVGNFDSSEAAYESNAFVQEFDTPDGVAIGSTPIGVLSPVTGGGSSVVVMAENPTGGFINADQYVFRLNPGDTGEVTLWANTFQAPAAGIDAFLFPSLSGLGPVPGIPVGTPPGVLTYPVKVTTDADGKATFTITATAPGNPRGPIDGQVYGVGWTWADDLFPDTNAFISVKVFDSVPIPTTPTWWEDVYPILVQYAYLYPVMETVAKIALDEYDSVVSNILPIIQRLKEPPDSPQYMPITRELSADKLAILLSWADSPDHPQGPVPVPPPVNPPLPPPPPGPGSGS